MRKIPTLFERDHTDPRRPQITDRVTPGCEWVLLGEGVATRKFDGTCVLIRRDGMAVHAYARREIKSGGKVPDGFVHVHTDPVTGKQVGWEPAAQSSYAALIAGALHGSLVAGTYELVGPKVNGNPERQERHLLVRHGVDTVDTSAMPSHFVGVRDFVLGLHALHGWEGLVWHHPDGRMAKIKARDFR